MTDLMEAPKLERYPFATMGIGDSFAVPSETVAKVRSAACQFAKRHPPMKFAVRLTNPVKRTFRCWRIA